jgi:hypothetical protein
LKVLDVRVLTVTQGDDVVGLEPKDQRIDPVLATFVKVTRLAFRTEPGGPAWFGLSEASADARAGTAAINIMAAARPQTSRPVRRE